MSDWWAKGMLFENCNCAVICPGHVHFSQGCTHDACIGYWAARVDEGEMDGVDLSGARAVVAFRSPKHMIEGGWHQVILLDSKNTEAQREKLAEILSGARGGPWAVLARFVATRLPTRAVDIQFHEEGKVKKVSIEGVMESSVEEIPGRDKTKPVTMENMFNQIHSPSQVVARGTTSFSEGDLSFNTEGSHGLHSNFNWRVGK